MAKGVCDTRTVVCVIVDECHRAVGDHQWVKSLREVVTDTAGAVRVIGLSATPGATVEMIQQVITNMHASLVCYVGADEAEVTAVRHDKITDVVTVRTEDDTAGAARELLHIQHALLCKLVALRAFNHSVPERASHKELLGAQHAAIKEGRSKCAALPSLRGHLRAFSRSLAANSACKLVCTASARLHCSWPGAQG